MLCLLKDKSQSSRELIYIVESQNG